MLVEIVIAVVVYGLIGHVMAFIAAWLTDDEDLINPEYPLAFLIVLIWPILVPLVILWFAHAAILNAFKRIWEKRRYRYKKSS